MVIFSFNDNFIKIGPFFDMSLKENNTENIPVQSETVMQLDPKFY